MYTGQYKKCVKVLWLYALRINFPVIITNINTNPKCVLSKKNVVRPNYVLSVKTIQWATLKAMRLLFKIHHEKRIKCSQEMWKSILPYK